MMRPMRTRLAMLSLVTALAACGGSDAGDDDDQPGELTLAVSFDGTAVSALASRPLASDEAVHLAVRRGTFGHQDCAQVIASTRAAGVADMAGLHLAGPAVDIALTTPIYQDAAWLEGTPSAEMLASIAAGVDTIIDLCVVKDGVVTEARELDLFATWDQSSTDPDRHLHSTLAYAQTCIAELGDIPFFTRHAEGDYSSYDCMNGTVVPMSVTDADEQVTFPSARVATCDAPQYLDGRCEPGARVAASSNELGTRWVILCRKTDPALPSGHFNDIALIGHNPFTGKTCFFQNALYARTDATAIPHPADVGRSRQLWSGVQGGEGEGLGCVGCHAADAWIHTPWIDGALDQNGRPVVPKMGRDPDYALGDTDAPYSLVHAAAQGWTRPRQIVDDQASACIACHRFTEGKWLAWLGRVDGSDTAFMSSTTTSAYQRFARVHWMPLDLSGLDEGNWQTSKYGLAIAFLKGCYQTPSACTYADIPTAPPSATTDKLYEEVTGLTDDELALRSLQLLGGPVTGSEMRCNECHAISRDNLERWRGLSLAALGGCLLEHAPGPTHDETSSGDLAQGQLLAVGPFTPGAGSGFSADLDGTYDVDLYLRRGSPPTTDSYDCASAGPSGVEHCELGPGAGQVYVLVVGYQASSYSLVVTYASGDGVAVPAKDMTDCIRLTPDDPSSSYAPRKLGIFAAASHLGYFQMLFRAAYPDQVAALEELARFKGQAGMPKGNHPKLTQDELNLVATWFLHGLPAIDTYLPVVPPPDTCSPSIGPELLAHVDAMATLGWAAKNAERGLAMFGCPAAGAPLDCLTAFPAADSQAFSTGWSEGTSVVRVLRALGFSTSYWERSSPDGRFVANGVSGGFASGAAITDLLRGFDIPTSASYDPGFFPDNSGFLFQGAQVGGTPVCQESLLEREPERIRFTEGECRLADNVGLYQHLGAALDGGDYFAVHGLFNNDDGGHFGGPDHDPGTGFGAQSSTYLTAMTNDGSAFIEGQTVAIDTPFEGDAILSPSTRLMISRQDHSGGTQNAYVVRLVDASRIGSVWNVSAPQVGTICVKGGKPAVSFDERFMAIHHYVERGDYADFGYASANDPAWQAYYEAGASNLYLVDLRTGESTRITRTHGGQFALYPHFRADGWLYFLVRDANGDHEYITASDAAIRLAAGTF
jgi:hypothetical protein